MVISRVPIYFSGISRRHESCPELSFFLEDSAFLSFKPVVQLKINQPCLQKLYSRQTSSVGRSVGRRELVRPKGKWEMTNRRLIAFHSRRRRRQNTPKEASPPPPFRFLLFIRLSMATGNGTDCKGQDEDEEEEIGSTVGQLVSFLLPGLIV